jgi:hypothetical protein
MAGLKAAQIKAYQLNMLMFSLKDKIDKINMQALIKRTVYLTRLALYVCNSLSLLFLITIIITKGQFHDGSESLSSYYMLIKAYED